MRRREVIAGAGAAAAWPIVPRAQQLSRIPRIGFLSLGLQHTPLMVRNLGGFRQALQDLGYVVGRNIAVEYRFAEGDFGRLPVLAKELVELYVDVIVATPTPAAVAARNATKTIPIVMFNVGDPVGLGLVASLARPGGNVTGLAFTVGTETFGKGLELLNDAVRDLRRVAVLLNRANPAHALATREIEVAARLLGLEIERLESRGPEDFDEAFVAMAKARAGALYTIADVQFVAHAARLADLAIEHRLPSMHQFREQVEAGGLMSYGHDFSSPWRGAAVFVDKLLKGANPADLPVEQPTKFELVINLKTARVLGLDIPPTLLARADEVIE